MSVPTVIAVIGGIALLIGIFGGGIRAKEIEIPSINARVRVFSTLTGIVLLAIAALLSSPEILNSPPKVPTEIQPTQNFISPPRRLTPSDYGTLLYEDNFDNDTAVWSLQKGSRIQNGVLALSPGEATFPSWNTKYSDFIFETSFQFANTISTDYSGMSVYLRFNYCSENCSSQVGVSTKGDVLAWNKSETFTKQILPATAASEFNSKGANKLTVVVNGKEFQIFLNDVFVRSFNDSTYKSGIIVLDVDGASIAFDYVRIYAVP
jgi:hypothetical protein